MAVLGHKTLTEAERYTREADQARLASAALAKLEGRSANIDAQTAFNGLGNTSKTEEKSK
jgi:enterobacteria phage integrase